VTCHLPLATCDLLLANLLLTTHLHPLQVALDAARLWAARQVIAREPELQARLQGAPAQEGRGGFDAAGRGLTTLRWSPLDEDQVRAELLGAGAAGDGHYVLYEVVETVHA